MKTHWLGFFRLIVLGALANINQLRSGAAKVASSAEPSFIGECQRVVSSAVDRNQDGTLKGMTVWPEYATDENFRLLAGIPTLEWLRFSYYTKSNLLTSSGIAALTNALNLREVSFQCVRGAPDSFFHAFGKLRQIEALNLIATWPSNSIAAHPLTNLPSLKRFSATAVIEFSAADIETVARMRSLQQVKLSVLQKLDESALGPIIAMQNLTNIEIVSPNFRMVRTRAR
jgi:hypothetical protein